MIVHEARPGNVVHWRCRDVVFDLGARTLVMGVVNVTPDSFSDGGLHADPAAALAHARRLLDEGADILDLGGESTRPGATPVAPGEQRRRLEPLVAPLAAAGACVSVDTASAEVAAWALDAGASIVNDVTALGDPGMAAVVASTGAGLVLMHMRGTPATMQDDPAYDDVARDVRARLSERFETAQRAGIEAERIALDPGIGFGKTVRHNLELLARLGLLAELRRPILIGVSRKGFLGQLSGRAVGERLEAGLAAAAIAVYEGAHIVRTHDVAATLPAVRVAGGLRAARSGATAPAPPGSA